MSEITYGNWITHASQVEEERALDIVHSALDLGVTSFDTADVYANTGAEAVLGKALAGQRRESLEIFTKVFWPTGPKGPNDTGLSRKHILESIHGSLRRLQTDYVDLYQAHRFDHETPLTETMQAFADLIRQGKILYVGVSEWSAEQLRAGQEIAHELGFSLVSNQPQYSALWRVPEAKVIPASERLGISQIVWSPLAQGVLTGKYRAGQELPAGSRATDARIGIRPRIEDFLTEPILSAVDSLRPIASSVGITVAQLALAWVLHNPNVSATIVGASRPEQLAETVKSSEITLPEDQYDAINEVLGPVAFVDPDLTEALSPGGRPA